MTSAISFQVGDALGRLRPVVPADAPLLSEWRFAASNWFLSEFPRDVSATESWIGALVENESRRLFMVEDQRSSPVGHMGLMKIYPAQKSAEIDNVVRGIQSSATRGMMSAALAAMMGWAQEAYSILRFKLQVFEDNPAIAFYEAAGFQTVGAATLLKRQVVGERATWVPSPVGERRLITMSVDYGEDRTNPSVRSDLSTT